MATREPDFPPLLEDCTSRDPFREFDRWLADAKHADLLEPSAMVLATATPDGSPSARVVLYRGITQEALLFFTNYESRKGRELDANPRAAAVFYWDLLRRQIRITGRVERASRDQSEAYFRSRPRGSQIAAWASSQSRPVESREALDRAWDRRAAEFEGRDVELPPFWGGYRLVAEEFEFWQNRENRLHDRLRYRRDAAGGWSIDRLGP